MQIPELIVAILDNTRDSSGHAPKAALAYLILTHMINQSSKELLISFW